jgi:error-prone DNA polymerase
MDTLALTDTNSLHGAVLFLETARDMGITPLLGSELAAGDRRAVALVRDPGGYADLCELISDCCCRHDIDLSRALRDRRRGLVVISDDPLLIKNLAGDGTEDLYVELSPGFNMAGALSLSRSTGIAPVATNRVYLACREQFPLHRVLRAVTLNTKLSRLNIGDTCTEYNFLASPSRMMDQFPHVPAAVENTVLIAERCFKDWDIGRTVFPRFSGMDDNAAFECLLKAVMDGCIRRYGDITPEVKARIEHEMKIIREKNFAHYFLVVADITGRAGRSCGRGSAAASIVSYALGITHVDPIRHNLFFERFLNPGRMDPPDIDVDFPWDERDRVIDYVFAAYGTKRAAMVANHNTFGARSAIRETARVFGLSDEEIRQVTGKIGYSWRLGDMEGGITQHPRMRDTDFKAPWGEIIHAASRLETHFRHLSTHCGGLVVVPDDIRRYCPVEISAKGLQVLQWDKDSVEDGGLVKIDILGNRSLAVIRDAIVMVEKNFGRLIDYASFNPIDDPATIRVFYDGDTIGVFYFESPATRQTLAKVSSGLTLKEYLGKDHFLLNVIVTSIIRPASNQSIDAWVSRLHGAPWSPPHPLLEPVLKETLGLMVFQEQLSQAAIHLAGFDAGEADTLRKVVSKKHRDKKLKNFYVRFVEGAAAKGVDSSIIEDVWRMMMGFDGYSFCKPHSASYTLVAYKSAWLRAHYPAEFMAAVISNGGGYYSTLGYISEARRMGLSILLPDINESDIKYGGKGKAIRVGLMQLKGLSCDVLDAIVRERSKNGPFSSLEEFLKRLRTGAVSCRASILGLEDVRILIKAGCFDGIEGRGARPSLMWETLRFFSAREDKGTLGLFSGEKEAISGPPRRPGLPSYSREIMLRHEYETLGLFISIHPLERYIEKIRRTPHVKAKDLKAWKGRNVTAVGWQITGKTVQSREGEPMKFISFEDTTGIYETVLFPAVYHRFCHLLDASRPYILKGRVEEDRGAITLNISRLDFLDTSRGLLKA